MEIVNQPKAFLGDQEVEVGRTRDGLVTIGWDGVYARLTRQVTPDSITIMSHAVVV